MPISYTPVAVTATSGGLTTGLIPKDADEGFVSITSASAANIVTLPTSDDVPVGWSFEGWMGATGCEMRTVASSNETINGTDADSAECAIPATTLIRVTKVAADTFILEQIDEGGDDLAGVQPD